MYVKTILFPKLTFLDFRHAMLLDSIIEFELHVNPTLHLLTIVLFKKFKRLYFDNSYYVKKQGLIYFLLFL